MGLVVTLAAVIVYSRYITLQISGLQDLQRELVDRNRQDSLQLLRIQNDLNAMGLAMRDMLDGNEPYPLTAWQSQFDRLRTDLDDALLTQQQATLANQTEEQREYLRSSMSQYWNALDRMFGMARDGREEEALMEVRNQLQARQAALSITVARLLVQNNESEEAVAAQIGDVYARVQRQVLLFLVATLVAILSTGAYLIHSNRRVFAELSSLSQQRSDLARALIASRESTLRHISRDLHDEFGQVLTAIGSLLDRSRRTISEASVRDDIQEVSRIAQSALDNVRSMSQALHPAILEEGGFENAIDWLVSSTRRRTGLDIHYEKSGTPFAVDADLGIHVYRILQEALNNVARHSGAQLAWVRLRFTVDGQLELEVEDHGRGFARDTTHRGIGLIAMRERAQLLGGEIQFTKPPEGGALVRLRVPGESLVSES